MNSEFGENFGQKEIRNLKNKYAMPNYSENGKQIMDLIRDFEEWCMTYSPYMKESFEGVTIDTGSQEISVTAKDKDEFGAEGETIIPLSDEKRRKIIGNTIEVDVEDIDEESFDELGESYFKKVYNNVKRYRTTEALLKNNALHISGDITFNSGKTKKTTFVLEAKDMTRAGKARFVGENLQINKGKKAFNVIGTLRKNKFIPESMDYNYRVKGKNVRGNVKTKAKPIKRVTESRLPRSKRRI